MLRDVAAHKGSVSAFGGNLLSSMKAEDRENLEGFASRLGFSYNSLYNWLYGKHLPGTLNLLKVSVRVERLVDELLIGVDKKYDSLRTTRWKLLGLVPPVVGGIDLPQADSAGRRAVADRFKGMNPSVPSAEHLMHLVASIRDEKIAAAAYDAVVQVIARGGLHQSRTGPSSP